MSIYLSSHLPSETFYMEERNHIIPPCTWKGRNSPLPLHPSVGTGLSAWHKTLTARKETWPTGWSRPANNFSCHTNKILREFETSARSYLKRQSFLSTQRWEMRAESWKRTHLESVWLVPTTLPWLENYGTSTSLLFAKYIYTYICTRARQRICVLYEWKAEEGDIIMDCCVCSPMASVYRPPRNTICASCYQGARSMIAFLNEHDSYREHITICSAVSHGSKSSATKASHLLWFLVWFFYFFFLSSEYIWSWGLSLVAVRGCLFRCFLDIVIWGVYSTWWCPSFLL